MSRLITIGDIHGCAKTFDHLVNGLIGLTRSDELVLLGDYVDRGPDSKGVIDLILDLQDRGFSVHALRGNHEQLMIDSRESDAAYQGWLLNGGDKTLESYGEPAYELLDPRHRAFIEGTHFCLMRHRYVFVHAGINFGSEEPFKDHHAMLWERNMTIDDDKLGDRIILHGHTPRTLEEVLEPSDPRNINLDAGCVYSHRPGMGYLVAYEPASGVFVFAENLDV